MTATIKTGGRLTIGAGGIAQFGTSSLILPPPTINTLTLSNPRQLHYDLNDTNTGGLITYVPGSGGTKVREMTISGSTVTFGSEVTKSGTNGNSSFARGFVRRYQSGATPNYLAFSSDASGSIEIFARAHNSSAVAQTTDTTIDSDTFQLPNWGSRNVAGSQVILFSQNSNGIQYFVVTESGGSISVQNSGTVVSSGSPNLISATDGVTDGRGLLLHSASPGSSPILRAYSITGNNYSESSTVALASINASDRMVHQIAAISTDIAVVLFWSGSQWTLRKVTGAEGTLALSGSDYVPVPGYSQIHSIALTRLNSTQALLGWTDGNDLKYQAVDCSGASPILTGSVKTLTRPVSMIYAFSYGGGWSGYWQYMSDGNVMAAWDEGNDFKFAILNDL